MSFRKILISFIFLLLISAVLAVYFTYSSIYYPNFNITGDSKILYIQENTSYKELKKELLQKDLLKNETKLDFVSRLMSFSDDNVKTGRYKIEPKISNREFITKIRGGQQDAVNVTFNNVRTLDQLSGKISKNLKIDSIEFLTFLNQIST